MFLIFNILYLISYLISFSPTGYGIQNDYLGLVVTTYPERNGSDFVEAFRQSVDDLHDVLQGNDNRK